MRFVQMLCAIALALMASAPARAERVIIDVPAGDVAGLTAAIQQSNANPNDNYEVRLNGAYTLTASLPASSGNLSLLGGSLTANGAGFRAITQNGGFLQLARMGFYGFRAQGDGGALLTNGGTLHIFDVFFTGNSASGNGGAIAATGTGKIQIASAGLRGNRADGAGGAISTSSTTRSDIRNVVSNDNCATLAGGLLNVNGTGGIGIFGATLRETGCNQELIEAPIGSILLIGNTIVMADSNSEVMHATFTPSQLLGNILSANASGPQLAPKALCSDFGTGAIRSLGANIGSDGSCALNQPGDLAGGNALLGPADANDIFPLTAGSPAIERGRATLVATVFGNRLPCGHRDARGLGRPQDNDQDGLYECDSGSYEVQAGANLVPGHTMAVFDPARGGEGSTIEILDGGFAAVSTFTYGANGGAAWFVGLGKVVGNSVVVDEMADATGGVFGAAFNPANVRRTTVGGTSFVFSDCSAAARPGNMSFAATNFGGYSDITAKASRLSTVICCAGERGPRVARSGSFHDPARSGEGVLVQHLTDGRVVLIYYGFNPQGQQIWILSDAATATINGDTITMQMVYPAATTRFGTAFNPAAVRLDPWGTFTLTYTGCNQLRIDYASTVAGYGSGTLTLTRLTTPTGIGCN